MSNVLVLGSGGREHAIVWSLKNDENVDKVFCAPGNGGTMMHAQNLDVDINDNKDILRIIKNNNIDFTIIGPENPLDNGIVDFLNENGCKVFGPSKYASKLESSKIFARRFMDKYNIPQPCFFECKNEEEVISVATKLGFPIVLKADGLAAGKGVIICYNQRDLDEALDIMFKDRKFGSAANRISVEECLKGQELSIFVVTDGENYKILNSAQDHKRIFDNDEGPNTGGMGAYCPSPLFDEKLREKVENRIIKPTINGMKKEGYPYKGFLYIGIMLVEGEPYMIEYNVRLGDPEAQVIIPMLDNDFLSVVEHTIDEKIDLLDIKNKDGFTVTVILASDGYPDKYEKNKEILGLDNSTLIFHSGTKYEDDTYYTNGGRVLSVIGSGDTLKSAIDNAYYNVKKIKFQNMYFRNDIGIKGLNFLKNISNE
tara:strand:- start:188 stop:1468 length:1281 start_codon:yes stop_codon:yes gene_type:complete